MSEGPTRPTVAPLIRYANRVYTCHDLEGHAWAFAQPARPMTAEEMAAATGRTIETKAGAHG